MSVNLRGLVFLAVIFAGLTGWAQHRPQTLPETSPPTIPPYLGIGTLRGDVKSSSGKSLLPNAFIYLHSNSGLQADKVLKLDDKARFEISLPQGLYDVFVSEGGYVPTCKRIEIGKGTTTEFSPSMQHDYDHALFD